MDYIKTLVGLFYACHGVAGVSSSLPIRSNRVQGFFSRIITATTDLIIEQATMGTGITIESPYVNPGSGKPWSRPYRQSIE